MAIRTVPFHSGRRIGLSMYLQEVLTRVRGHASPDLKKKLKSGKSDRISFISVQLREPRRNGWHRGFSASNRSSYLIDVLTVDEGVSQIRRVFEYVATPSEDMLKPMAQRTYAQTAG